MVTELVLLTLHSVAVTWVDSPAAEAVLVVPTPLVIDESTFESVMFQVTSLVTSVFPVPLKVAVAMNVIETELPCVKVSGLAVIVRLVTAGQTESVAVAGVRAW
jgi:hypothetical protein